MKHFLYLFILCLLNKSFAQTTSFGENLNTITSAVPFLTISPDSRAGSMGEVGAATSPDLHSIHWNSAKLAFLEEDGGFSILRKYGIQEFIEEHSIDFVVHGDDMNDEELNKWYGEAIKQGKFIKTKYTPTVSTSDIIRRVLSRYSS